MPCLVTAAVCLYTQPNSVRVSLLNTVLFHLNNQQVRFDKDFSNVRFQQCPFNKIKYNQINRL